MAALAADFVLSGVLALEDAVSGPIGRAKQALRGFTAATTTSDRGATKAQRAFASLGGAGRQASAQIDYAANGIDRSTRRIGGSLNFVKRAVVGLVGAFAAKQAFDFTVGGAAQIEQLRISFDTLLGSEEKAGDMLQWISDFAAKTPFELPGLADAAKLLVAFKFDAADIPNMLTTIGDAAAGVGAGEDGFNRIIRALGQMQAKGRVSQEELNQLTELGIGAAQILQDKLGLTAEQMQNIGAEGIDAATAIDALLSGMGEQFGGMMSKQSRSFRGLASTMFDNLKRVGVALGGLTLRGDIVPESLFTAAKRVVDGLGQSLDAFLKGDSIEKIQKGLGQFANNAIDAFARFGDTAINLGRNVMPVLAGGFRAANAVIGFAIRNWPILGPIVFGIAGAIGGLKVANAVVGGIQALRVALMALTASNPVILAIGAIIGIVGYLVYRFIKASGGLENAWEKVKLVFQGGVAITKAAMASFALGVIDAITPVVNGFQTVVGFFQDSWDRIKTTFNLGVATIKATLGDLMGRVIAPWMEKMAGLPLSGNTFKGVADALKDFQADSADALAKAQDDMAALNDTIAQRQQQRAQSDPMAGARAAVEGYRDQALSDFATVGDEWDALNTKIASDLAAQQGTGDSQGFLGSMFASNFQQPQTQQTSPAGSPIQEAGRTAAENSQESNPEQRFDTVLTVNVTPAEGQQLDTYDITKAVRDGMLEAGARMGAGA